MCTNSYIECTLKIPKRYRMEVLAVKILPWEQVRRNDKKAIFVRSYYPPFYIFVIVKISFLSRLYLTLSDDVLFCINNKLSIPNKYRMVKFEFQTL